MHAVERDGGTLHECGLCGATYGDRRARDGASLASEARARGVDQAVWPLARVLEQLPGFELGACRAGGGGELPSVELVVVGQAALMQLENLAKALRLAAGSLRCRWMLEARFELTLSVLVRATGDASDLRCARIDVETLAQQLTRDVRLSWWRHATEAEKR